MRHPLSSRSGRAALAGLAAAALTTGSFGAAAAAAQGPGDPGALRDKAPRATLQKTEVKENPSLDRTERKLGQHDVALLGKARSAGTKRVTLILAVDKGTTKQVAASIRAKGGFVGMTNDKVGYVRASVPTSAVLGVAGLTAVRAVDLDESVQIPAPGTEGRAGLAADVAGPGPSTPDANPYMPTREVGSTAFKTSNPTYDGRGVTIGILDSGVDLDHPALAETSTGQRKIVDWVTATDPIFDNDATWRPMLTEVEAGPTFTVANVAGTWTAPSEGTFLFNRFSENITAGSEPDGDVNRDGDTTDRFGVLYDADTHDIWVDSNQDQTFSDAELMRPYGEDYDIGHFGTDDPETAVVERMPFVVEYREDVDLSPYGGPYVGLTADYVNIGIVEDAHGSHVAGIAAAHSLFGGAMDGQAPGAKIVSSRACTWGGGCTNAALTDGMVDLVANRGVDVVNMSIGGLPALNDGANARAELYNRLIDVYGVQLFISAGNSGAGINTVGDPSVATDVVSVASSVSKETWLANYGSSVSSPLALHNYSSRGPREDGGFKPNIMAPGSAISTVPQWLKQPDLAEAGYELPIGYAMFNGTSMASPQAAGAAALLLSAGVQTETPITPKQLRESLYTTADYKTSLEAAGQGTGQLDVRGAWSLLAKRPTKYTVTGTAPVCSALSGFLATPGKGTGLWNDCAADKGGQPLTTAKKYTVTLNRTSGSVYTRTLKVRIVGNDGTFSAPTSVALGKGKAKNITVTATARTTGLHSAILEVDDPATALVDHRMMLNVTVSRTLPKPSYSTTTTSSVQRNLYKRVFVTVPAGAKALQVNLSGIATKSQVRWIAFNPYGVPVDNTSTPFCYTNYSDPATCKPQSRAYANPIPGVWELLVESRRTSPFLDNPYTLKAAVQGLTVDPETQTVDAPVGESTPVSWTVRNDFGPVTVTPRGGSLGSALAERATVADGDTLEYEVVVPEGATRFDAAIGNTSDLSADLDLTVYDAEGNTVAQSADGDSEEAVSIADPAAGTYTVEVDGYSVPAGTTQFDYRDVFFSPALGTLDVPSSPLTLAVGASATVTGSVSPEAAAGDGRQLFGEMRLLSTEGAVLGTGSVLVSSPAAR